MHYSWMHHIDDGQYRSISSSYVPYYLASVATAVKHSAKARLMIPQFQRELVFKSPTSSTTPFFTMHCWRWWGDGRKEGERPWEPPLTNDRSSILKLRRLRSGPIFTEMLKSSPWKLDEVGNRQPDESDVDHPEVINVSFTRVHWSFASIFSNRFCRERMIIKLLILLNKAWLYRWSMITNLFFQALWLFSYAANEVYSLLQDSKQSIII